MAIGGLVQPVRYARVEDQAASHLLAFRESGPPPLPKPRFLDRVRESLRTRHYSARTEKAYVGWIRRYILFHGKRHPAEMGAAEVSRFLTSLAVDRSVAASTQNQALSALLFLYREVLGQDLPWLEDLVRAKRPPRLPVVLTRDEVRAVLDRVEGVPSLMAVLMYGSGLRVLECARLRVKDIGFSANQIVVRGGKGDKDRVTMLPTAIKPDLERHLARVRVQHQHDLADGAGWVELPFALARKYPHAGRESGHTDLRRARDRSASASPPPRVGPPACREVRRTARRDHEARDLPRVQTLVCDAPAGRRSRHPHGAGASRPQRCFDDDDLHARPEPRSGCRPQPGRSDVRSMRRRPRHPLVRDTTTPVPPSEPVVSRTPTRVSGYPARDIRISKRLHGYRTTQTRGTRYPSSDE